jgi:hypothetical protein
MQRIVFCNPEEISKNIMSGALTEFQNEMVLKYQTKEKEVWKDF